jgi:hypothetical protein
VAARRTAPEASIEPQNSTHDRAAVETAFIETSFEGRNLPRIWHARSNYNHLRELKVIIFGASGMIGAGRFWNVFADPRRGAGARGGS